MSEVSSEYINRISPFLQPKHPRVPFASSVTSTFLQEAHEFGPQYWQNNLQKPVVFRQAISTILKAGLGNRPFLEIGPHSTLAGPLKQIFKENGVPEICYTSIFQRGSHAVTSFLSALGYLHCSGVQNILLRLILEDGASLPPTLLKDLPPYPWDLRERCYSPRSTRLLREWNFPRSRPHELLGRRVSSSCGAAPQWRCIISPEAIPWISDHSIRSEVILPAAAYVAMAGELVMQLGEGLNNKQDHSVCSGFFLRDLRMETALVMFKGQSVELFIEAHAGHNYEPLSDLKWWKVSVWSLSSGHGGQDDWVKHFACRAQAVDQSHVVKIPSQLDKLAVKLQNFDIHHPRLVNPPSWYKALRKVGYKYGPHFRAMDCIRAATTSSDAYCSVKSKLDVNFDSTVADENDSYIMHPTMIDHMLQALVVAGHYGEPRRVDKLWLPTMIEEIFVAQRSTSRLRLNTERLCIQAEARNLSQGLVLGFSGPEQASLKDLTVWMRGVKFSPLPSLEVEDLENRQYAFSLIAKPDIDLIDPSLVIKSRFKSREIECIHHQLQQLWDLYAHDLRHHCLQSISDGDSSSKPAANHLKKHYKWIQQYEPKASSANQASTQIGLDVASFTSNELLVAIQNTPAGPAATLLERCHRHAQALFTGEVDPLEMLYQDHGLQNLYDWMNSLWCYQDLFEYISHKHGRYLKILEIGAGTGGLTAQALKYLTISDPDASVARTLQQNGFAFGKYVFTDISAAFLPAAKARFAWVPSQLMDYAVLDISQDPREQGFQVAEYDLIIASNVLHATPNLHATLCNVRMLLKPDGRLLMQELCADTKWINFIMGFLPGWWSGQEDPVQRLHEPYLSPAQWNNRLVDAGFNSAEAIVYDVKPPLQLNATILARPATWRAPDLQSLSRAVEDQCTGSKSLLRQRLSLLVPSLDDPSVSRFVEKLHDRLRKWQWTVSLLDMNHQLFKAEDFGEGHIIVSLLDLFEQDGWFFDISKDKLKTFQQLVQEMQAVHTTMLWLTRPCQASYISNPNFALCLGVARTVRVESDLQFATLEIDDLDHGNVEEAIHRVVQSLRLDVERGANKSASLRDMEYVFSSKFNGRAEIIIPRARPISIAAALSNPDRNILRNCGLGNVGATIPPQTAISLTSTRMGSIDNLEWRQINLKSLTAKQVEIRILASGLNFKDVFATMGIGKATGFSPADGAADLLGCEAAGTVIAVGDSVSHIAMGDRVAVFAPHEGCFSTKVRVDARLCVRIPEEMTMTEAAGMPCVFTTVLRSLMDKANLRAGQTLLIHSAAGGVGVSAMQLARFLGVTPSHIYATTGSPKKRSFLIEKWQIPPGNIFGSRDDSFVDGIMNATGGRGADVVLNTLSGDLLHASWRCVAPGGTLVELGKKDIVSRDKLSLVPFDDNRTFTAVDMARLAEQEPDVVGRLMHKMIQLHKQSAISSPQPLKVVPYEKIKNAFRILSTESHVGKVVVDMEGCEKTDGVGLESCVPCFDPTGIYLLVGGFGGLGACIARWMVSYGAKKLFFLSRSAGKGRRQDTTLLNELQSMGCETVAMPCDIRDQDDVNACLAAICSTSDTPRRIAGVMFLPMVLADAALPDMSIDDWHAASDPKVKGAWHVHNALMATCGAARKALDFFILFSSMSGFCGFPGQANYAAANSFLDAFSLYRHGVGQPCAVLDLGPLEDNGYVSESPEVQEKLVRAGSKLLGEREFLSAVQLAMSRCSNFAHVSAEEDGVGCPQLTAAQLAIGFEVTVPLDDPQNSVVWKSDARMALHCPTVSTSDVVNSTQPLCPSAGSEFVDYVTRLRGNPIELSSESTRRVLAEGILTHVLNLISREHRIAANDPVSMSWVSLDADSLVTIEMKSWWRRAFGARISSSQLSNATSFMELADIAIGHVQKMTYN